MTFESVSAPDPHQLVLAAVEAIANGAIVVVTDDYDRENEGDLVMAAQHASPEKLAFIVRHTCGIVCAPLDQDVAHRLRLAPMVNDNDAPHRTAFTISVDSRTKTTTGVSASDRANTLRELAASLSTPADFVRPGHVFPLVARSGGVLMRSGHTEAAVDLCRLAGLPAVGVICELMNDNGTVMRGPQIAKFSDAHGLVQIAVRDLITYRQAREKLVRRVDEFDVESEIGMLRAIAYVTPFDDLHHVAFVYGDISDGRTVPTRIHRANLAADLFGGAKPVKASLKSFKEQGRGILIFLRDGAAGVPAVTTSELAHTTELARKREWKEIGLGAQILRDLGVRSIHMLTWSERTLVFVGLSGFGIKIDRVETLDHSAG